MDSMLLFLLTIIVGGSLAAVLYVLWKVSKSASRVLQWWHWLLTAIWVLTFVVAFAFLGSILGESAGGAGGLERGAWLGFAIVFGFNILLGLVIWQLLRRQKAISS